MNKFLYILNRIAPLLDLFLGFLMISEGSKKEGGVKIILVVLGIVYIALIVWRCLKSAHLVRKSKQTAIEYCSNNRVIPITGKQRSGKTSLSLYFCKVLGNDVFSNVPIKIKNKYAYRLDTDMLSLKSALPELSTIFIDEASLYYSNLEKVDTTDTVYGQSIYCQCIGHFTDGVAIYACTDTGRLPKTIRDNYSCTLQTLGRKSFQYSFVGSIFVKIVAFILRKPLYTGLTIWECQHYEKVFDDQYTSILGMKDNQFSPIYSFYDYQCFGENYNDRYMKGLYTAPPCDLEKWDSLEISPEKITRLYDSTLVNYLRNIGGHK